MRPSISAFTRLPLMLPVILGLVGSVAACGAGTSEPPACQRFASATSVDLKDFSYLPECIGADTGAALLLDNVGSAPHTFTLEGTEVDVDVAAGEQGSADLSGVDAGFYTVTCTYHPQMVARIEVG